MIWLLCSFSIPFSRSNKLSPDVLNSHRRGALRKKKKVSPQRTCDKVIKAVHFYEVQNRIQPSVRGDNRNGTEPLEFNEALTYINLKQSVTVNTQVHLMANTV